MGGAFVLTLLTMEEQLPPRDGLRNRGSETGRDLPQVTQLGVPERDCWTPDHGSTPGPARHTQSTLPLQSPLNVPPAVPWTRIFTDGT